MAIGALLALAVPIGSNGVAHAVAPLGFNDPVTDNYKAIYNKNPDQFEPRTWLSVASVSAAGVTFTPTEVPEDGFYTVPAAEGLPVSGSDGSDGLLTGSTDSPSSVDDGNFRVDYTGRFGYLGTITSREDLQETPMHVEFTLIRNGTTFGIGTADYVYQPGLGDGPDTGSPKVHKGAVRAPSSTDVNIDAPGSTVGGVVAQPGHVFLLTGQNFGPENGPWVWHGASVPMTRPANWDTVAEAVVGSYWNSEAGEGNLFALMTNTEFTLGESTAEFVFSREFNGPGGRWYLDGVPTRLDWESEPPTGGDLGVTITAPALVVGDVPVFVTTISNAGPGPNTADLVLTLDEPPYVSVNPSQGTCDQMTPQYTVTCSLGTVNPGQTVTVEASVPQTTRGQTSFMAEVMPGPGDPNPANDEATLTRRVTGTTCTAVGTAQQDNLTGGAGTDVLCGFGGKDVLVGAAGDDELLGGPGLDAASYAPATAAVVVNLTNQDAYNRKDGVGNTGYDTMRSIEEALGSPYGDVLVGSTTLGDVLRGYGGRDKLLMYAGNDTGFGGPGNDKIYGGDGKDTLFGGDGDDSLDGGPGRDRCVDGPGAPNQVNCER